MGVQIAVIGGIAISREETPYLSGAHIIMPDLACSCWSLVFCVECCKSLFVLLFFFFWPLYCLSSELRFCFTIRILKLALININNKYNDEFPNPIYNYPSKATWHIYDRCRSNNKIVNNTHLPLPCRDKMNMSVCGDVLLIIHLTLSDGSSTVNVVILGLMLIGLIVNLSWRPFIIGGYNDNDHMSNTLWVGSLWHDL